MALRSLLFAFFALLFSWPAIAGDAGDVALGLKPEELMERLKPLRCRPVPESSVYQVCSYFPPPETHKHLRVEALESFAGFPVSNAGFAFLGGTLDEISLTFPSGRALIGSTVDSRKLAAALEARFGTPTKRRHVARGTRGGGEDETVWEAPGERWTLHLDSSGAANAYLVRGRKARGAP